MKKSKRKLSLIIFSALSALFVAELVHSNLFLKTTEYNLKSDRIEKKIKIVLISDLHNKEYGTDNSELVNKIKEQQPDFIAVAGDMVTRNYINDDIMKSLLTKISKINGEVNP